MKTKLLLVCIALLFISSCTPLTQRRDLLEIITTSSCAPPCWRGITPGESTFAEAKELVQGIQDDFNVNKGIKLKEIKVDEEYKTILINFSAPPLLVRIPSASDGIIDKIWFSTFVVNNINKVKLGDLFDYLGEPDTFGFWYFQNEIREVNVGFSYPQIQFHFNKSRLPVYKDTFEIQILENSGIDTLIYYNPSGPPPEEISASWSGYGCFQITPSDPTVDIKKCEVN
jgi:hypothetical protein